MNAVTRYMRFTPWRSLIPQDQFTPALAPLERDAKCAHNWTPEQWADVYQTFEHRADASGTEDEIKAVRIHGDGRVDVDIPETDDPLESPWAQGADAETTLTATDIYGAFDREPPWCADGFAMKMARRGFICAVIPLNAIPGARFNDEGRRVLESVMRASLEEVAERSRIAGRPTTIPDDATCFLEKMREAGHAIEVFPESELAGDTAGMRAQDVIDHMERRGDEIALYLANLADHERLMDFHTPSGLCLRNTPDSSGTPQLWVEAVYEDRRMTLEDAIREIQSSKTEDRVMSEAESEQIRHWAAEHAFEDTQSVNGYMLFLPDRPSIGGLHFHPAYSPEDPKHIGGDIRDWSADRWANAYHVHRAFKDAASERDEDHEEWIAHPDHDDDDDPMTIAPVEISANGDLRVMDHATETAVMAEQKASEIYAAFGMSPEGIDEVSDRHAGPDDDPMNDDTQRPSNGPSLG